MDGTQVWPRTSPGGKPAVYGTRNAGKTWQRMDEGMPASQAWWTVKRQCMAADGCDPAAYPYFREWRATERTFSAAFAQRRHHHRASPERWLNAGGTRAELEGKGGSTITTESY